MSAGQRQEAFTAIAHSCCAMLTGPVATAGFVESQGYLDRPVRCVVLASGGSHPHMPCRQILGKFRRSVQLVAAINACVGGRTDVATRAAVYEVTKVRHTV